MQMIGTIVIRTVMVCLVLGVIGAIRDPDKGIGFEFCEGVRQLGTIFIPIAGVMASLPYMQSIITAAFSGLSRLMGHDLAMWAGIILPPDIGGNLLVNTLASTPEAWIIALFTAFILGSGVTFGIPLSISMVPKRDHRELAMGILCGLIACPVGITVSCALCMYTDPAIRAEVSTVLPAAEHLHLTWPVILLNLLPVYILCALIAVIICLFPEKAVKGFLVFGRVLTGLLYVIFALAAVEYFTGLFSALVPGWRFDPIIADAQDYNRALETAGYCALMLGGAYPMMYLLQKYGGKGIAKIGEKLGLSAEGCLGILASSVTLVALFRAFEKMPPIDKARSAAWAISSGYLLADHLVYCYNFQPQLYGCLLIGKLTGGILSVLLVSPLMKRHSFAESETA